MTGKDIYYVSQYTTEILYLPTDEEAAGIHEVNIESGLGGYLWDAVKNGNSAEAIIKKLTGDFGMTVEEASHTMNGFLRILMKYGYIREMVV